MDEVKKFLRERRDELDVEPFPADHVWQYIEKSTRAPKAAPIVRLSVKWMAAAAVVLMMAGIGYIYTKQPSPAKVVAGIPVIKETHKIDSPHLEAKSTEGTVTKETENKTEAIAPVPVRSASEKKVRKTKAADLPAKAPVEVMEENYAGVINYQLNRVNRMPIYGENAHYFHSFKKQWQQFQKDEQNLMQDIQQAGINDNMVDRLITLYQQKLLLLKQLQTEINKMNNRARKNPAAAGHSPSFMNL